MAKFTVVVVDLGIEGGDTVDVQKLVACDHAEEVMAAVQAVDVDVQTWALFEAVQGRHVRRSVTIYPTGCVIH